MLVVQNVCEPTHWLDKNMGAANCGISTRFSDLPKGELPLMDKLFTGRERYLAHLINVLDHGTNLAVSQYVM